MNMEKTQRKQNFRLGFGLLLILVLGLFCLSPLTLKAAAAEPQATIQAQDQQAEVATTDQSAKVSSAKALAAAITVGFAGALGTCGMAYAIGKSNESIARQPEAESGIRSSLTLGLVFIETLVIYTLIVAILIIFVL